MTGNGAARWRYNATKASTSGNWAGKNKNAANDRRAKAWARQVKDDLLNARGELKLGRRHRPEDQAGNAGCRLWHCLQCTGLLSCSCFWG